MHEHRQDGRKRAPGSAPLCPRRLQLEPLEERLLLDGGGLSSISPAWFQVLSTPSEPDALAGAAPATESLSWNGASEDVRTGLWIVQFTDKATATVNSVAETASLLAPGGVDFQVVKGLGQAGQVLISTPGASADDVTSWLGHSANVASFEPDQVIYAAQVPGDAGFANQWGLDNTGQGGGTPGADIDAAAAWDITTGSPSVVIAIVDTGVDLTQPDIAPNLWTNPGEIAGNGVDDDHDGFVDDVHGYDFADNDANPSGPTAGHGTLVAGVAAGAGDNSIGGTGVAWHASIMALKIFGDDGSGDISAAISALNYAAMMRKTYGVNVRVINDSWINSEYDSALYSAVQADGNAGILTVAASGNTGGNVDSSPLYPAAFNLSCVISVAGTDDNDALASFSSWGPTTVDLAAPAVGIYGPTIGGGYVSSSGVSFAAPFVSGVAALAWSADPSATVAQVRSAILSGVDPIPSLAGKMVTGGRLNALGTLDALLLHVTGSTPAGGDAVTAAPTAFVIDFSMPVDPTSLAAGDLQVNGIAASAYSIVDPQTVRFTYTASPVVNEGAQLMHVAAGAVRQSGGTLTNLDWTAAFNYQSPALAVTASTPQSGQQLGAAPTSIVLDFNQAVKPTTIGTDDLVLSAGRVTAASAVDADTVSYSLSGLPTDAWVSWSLKPGALTNSAGAAGVGAAGEFYADGSDVVRYSYTGTPTAIPAAGVVTSQIVVSDPFKISDLDVLLDVTGGTDADLRATLIAPDGTRVPLLDRVGGSGSGFDDTLLDGEAPTSIADGLAPFAARYRPQGNLAGLDGKSTQGTWGLELSGLAAGQTGTLQGWSLLVARTDAVGPHVVSQSPSGLTPGAPGSITFGFSEPMDTMSFSTAADVVSFTGPQGNLAGAITGFAWVDSQTLRVDFQQQTATGNYQMVIGPQILDLAGNPMDQNGDGVNGSVPADRYTASFSLNSTPSLVVSLLASSDSGVSNSDRITNDTTPTYAITFSEAGTVQIDWQGDGKSDLTAAVPGAGTYQYTPSAPLPGGSYPVLVTFVGADLQTVTGQAPTVIDTAPPAAPPPPLGLTAASDTGVSSTDNLTSDTTPTINVGTPGGYYRLFRDGVQVSSDYATASTFTDGTLAEGAHSYTLRAVDVAGNASAPSTALTVIVDTTGPSVTATSPSGTASASPSAIGITFADPNGLWASTVTDKTNYVLYASGGDDSFADNNQVNLTGQIVGVAYDSSSGRATLNLQAPLGDDAYQVRVQSLVRDAAGNTLGHGAGYTFSFIVDASAPTLAVALDTPTIGGNLVADSTPTYDVTVSEPGRLAIDWQGDGTTDLSAVLAAAGTYQFTPASPLAAGAYPVLVNFTDTAGHQVQAQAPTTVATTIQQGGAAVTLVSTTGTAQFKPADVAVKFGKSGTISSITLAGTDSMQGLGILISGAGSVGSIKDARTGPIGDLAFIASSAPVKAIALKSGLTGYDINGLSSGNLVIPADIDGDGDTSDLTALYATAAVGSVSVGGNVAGDVWIGGDVGTISLGGNLGATINVSGALKGLTLTGGNMSAGARVYAGGGLSALTVGGSLVGGAGDAGLVQVLAPTIGSIKITGSVSHARILAGADLGADWAPGGTGADADTFQRGTISKMSIGGAVSDSLIGAGLVTNGGAFDLAWLASNSAFLTNSTIGSVSIGGALTSDASSGIPYGIGANQISKLKLGAGSNTALVVT